ncbi:MAG: monovalent cation/H(+) antiporter subunit G [Planctomycetota bacterium]|jgi:multicomponent Na+:H+ antiporter subunit G
MNQLEGFTWNAATDFLAAFFLLSGIIFMVIGSVGTHRLPDAYNRMHAASKCVTLGLTGMLLAACFHLGSVPVISKAVITIIFTFVATPIGTHMLAKASHHARLTQWQNTLEDQLATDKEDPTMSASDEVTGGETIATTQAIPVEDPGVISRIGQDAA